MIYDLRSIINTDFDFHRCSIIKSLRKNSAMRNNNTIEIPKNFQICAKTTSIEHLKKYWTKTLLLIHRLEKQWQFSFKKEPIQQHDLYLTKIKTLLGCYQLLIVQFNEYCQVLEIQGLGKCMMKIFIQIIAIVDSILKNRFEIRVRNQRDTQSQSDQQKNSKESMKRSKEKNDKYYISSDNEYFAEKQKKKFQVRQLENQLQKVEQKYYDEINFFDDQKMNQARRRVVTLEPSNAQFIIREAFMSIESKQNSFIDIMELRNQRIQQEAPKDYKKSCDLISQNIEQVKAEGRSNAMDKLMQIVQKFLNQRQIKRKSKLVDKIIQTVAVIPAPSPGEKLERQKLKKILEMKQMEIKKLKQEIQHQKHKNQSVEKVLRQKIENYEKQMVRQRMTMMKLQQRISITTKTDKSEPALTMDFVTSQHTMMKEQSQKDISKSTLFIDKEKPKIAKKKSYSRQYSRSRPSYEEIKQSLDQRKYKPSSFMEKKKQKKLSTHSNAFQIVLISSSKVKLIQNSELRSVFSDAYVQTQKIKEPVKQKQKIVKFKSELRMKEQYSIIINGFIKNESNFLKQKQINFNIPSDGQNLLKKKKTIVNWSNQRVFRTLKRITEEDEYDAGYDYKRYSSDAENQQGFESLCIDGHSKNSKNKNGTEFNYQATMQSPSMAELDFNQTNVADLFLKTEKAANFQFMSYNIQTWKNRYFNLESMRSQANLKTIKNEQIQSIKNQRTRPQSCHVAPEKAMIKDSQVPDPIIKYLSRHLAQIRHKNPEKYEKLKNFLRYPHSAIFKSVLEKKKFVGHEEQQIGEGQLRKIFFRFSRIHAQCKKKAKLGLCEHLQVFLKKIGLGFVPLVPKNGDLSPLSTKY